MSQRCKDFTTLCLCDLLYKNMLIKIVIFYYLLLINIGNFLAFGIDKRQARKNKGRIPESTLMSLSILGGAVGGLFAMYIFKHKKKKARFFLMVPMLCALHIILLTLIFFRNYLEVL